MQTHEVHPQLSTGNLNFQLFIVCLMLIFCFDFFRIIGDILEALNLPVLLIYGTVIFMSVITPLLLIAFGFRYVPPIPGFIIVFIITCPMTILIDLVFFSTAPLDLITTPAYLIGIFIVSCLLGVITTGVTVYSSRQNLACILLITGIVLYLFQYRELFFDLIGLTGVCI